MHKIYITIQKLTVSWGEPECEFLKYWWQWGTQWYSNNAFHDTFDIQVHECVMMHTRSQVDKLTYTFLVLSSLFCSAVIAALQRRKYSWFLCLLLPASSGVSLSLLSLYCSLLCQRCAAVSIQHEQWTSPLII